MHCDDLGLEFRKAADNNDINNMSQIYEKQKSKDDKKTLLDSQGKESKQTALHRAAGKGNLAAINWLMCFQDADPMIRDKDNKIPLTVALDKGKIKEARVIASIMLAQEAVKIANKLVTPTKDDNLFDGFMKMVNDNQSEEGETFHKKLVQSNQLNHYNKESLFNYATTQYNLYETHNVIFLAKKNHLILPKSCGFLSALIFSYLYTYSNNILLPEIAKFYNPSDGKGHEFVLVNRSVRQSCLNEPNNYCDYTIIIDSFYNDRPPVFLTKYRSEDSFLSVDAYKCINGFTSKYLPYCFSLREFRDYELGTLNGFARQNDQILQNLFSKSFFELLQTFGLSEMVKIPYLPEIKNFPKINLNEF